MFVEPAGVNVYGDSGFVPATVYVHDGSDFVEALTTEQAPYGGTPRKIPGRLQAENFDTGGEGVAYHDTTSMNKLSAYRDTGVDIGKNEDSSGTYNIGYTNDGEWLEYSVDVTQGTYDLLLRVASDSSNPGTVHLEIDGSTLASFDVSNTGGWQSWTTLRASDVSLTEGKQILRVEFDGGNINLNWIEVVTPDTEAPTAPSNLSSPGHTGNSVDLTWDASSDNVGVDHYNVYLDGSKTTESTTTSATVEELNENTTYDFSVTAVDAAGNESGKSNVISVTTDDTVSVTQWDVFEVTLTNEGSHTNSQKYRQVSLDGTFTGPDGQSFTIPGFWDGGDTFRIRFAPPETGTWTWESTSSEASLDGLTGSFDVVGPTQSEIDANPNLRGFLKPVKTTDGRYFEYADGTPFLYAGGAIWDGNSKEMAYESDFRQYVDDRKAKGFTTIQILVGEPSNSYGGGRNTGNNEGGLLFAGTKSSPDYSEINPSNLQNLDKRIEYIHDTNGMVPNLFFEWGGQYDDQILEQLKNYYQYLVARYGAYNVIFTVSGEYDFASYYPKTAKMNDSASHADSHDSMTHPTSIHPSTDPSSSSTDFDGEEWLDYHTHQPGDTGDINVLEDDWDTGVPLIDAEPHVANNFGTSRIEVRRDAWQVLISGRAAGMAHLYYPIAYDYDTVDDLNNHIDAPETKDMARAYRYIADKNWSELVPAQSLVLSGQSSDESSIKVASYLPDGSLELVYFSDNSSGEIDLSEIDGSSASLHWYRTTDGSTSSIGTYSTSDTPTLSPPSGWSDALLVAQPA